MLFKINIRLCKITVTHLPASWLKITHNLRVLHYVMWLIFTHTPQLNSIWHVTKSSIMIEMIEWLSSLENSSLIYEFSMRCVPQIFSAIWQFPPKQLFPGAALWVPDMGWRMDVKHRKALTSNRVELMENLVIDETFLAYFYEKEILQESHTEKIQVCYMNYMQFA